MSANSLPILARKFNIALVLPGIALLVYFTIGLTNLHLPGPQNDEVADAVPAMELLRGLPSSAFDNIVLFGVKLPLMMGHYTGPTSIYTSLAGMAVFGTTTEGLRTGQLVLGAFSCVLLWVLARRWYGGTVAGLTVLLCATAPAFIWWNRFGAHFASPIVTLTLVLLLFLTEWWDSRKSKWLIASAFVFGVGLTTKLLFVWLVVPIALISLSVHGASGIFRLIRSIPLRIWVMCVLAGLLGLLPFILHNLPAGASFSFIGENAIQSRAYSHNNLDVFGNVQFETLDFLRMMSGDTLHFDAPSPFPVGAFVVVICVVYSVAYCIKHRTEIPIETGSTFLSSTHTRIRLFLVLFVVTIIPLGTISISGIGARHLFLIVPLVWLLIATCIVDLYGKLHKLWNKPAACAVTGALMLAVVGNHVVANLNMQTFFATTGGKGLWSDSLYTLDVRLQKSYSDRHLIALDWGFERSIAFISQGQTKIHELYEYLPEPSSRFLDLATILVRDAANIYIFHAPELTQFKGHLEALQRAAAIQNKGLSVLETINERDGTPFVVIYGAEALPRSFDISPTQATRNAVFGGGITLLGGTVNYALAQHEVAIQLYWQATTPNQPDDVVLIHIVNQDTGAVVIADDKQPVYGSYPFSQWQKGEVVIDPHWVSLPADTPPGTYQVRVGIYDRQTGVRRTISDPQNDAAGNSLMLHWFTIK